MFHPHAVAGSLGAILTGLFAESRLTRLFFTDFEKKVGLSYEWHYGIRQMGLQIGQIVFIVVLNIVMTSFICLFIRLIVPLRLCEEDVQIGDDAIHHGQKLMLYGVMVRR